MQRYNIFRDQNIALAKSMIVKSDTIAQQMNLGITEQGGYVLEDRNTWRYYQHLAGIRHEVDKPLLITSLDTQELIELTTANLARHKKTSNIYRSNLTYIDALIVENLDYDVYIKGVFWPVPLSVSVPAPDCTVLYYNPALIEPQETSLITEMEKWMLMAHVRYMADGWKVHNDAFVLAFYAQHYPKWPGVLMWLRQEKMHTNETHSYHVTEFLASHQELHEFVPYLNQKQKFTLYRNIRYWERNSGKANIFDWMVDTLLTGWGMPAVSYKVSQLTHTPTDDDDSTTTPLPTGYSSSLNYQERDSGRDLSLLPTTSIIQKEYGLAYNNNLYEVEYQSDLDTRLGLTLYPDQPTKLVEVTAVDPEAIERWEFTHLLFNEWLHQTARGRYNISHEVLNPTNGDTLKMSTKELMALYLYAGFKGYSDFTLETIPDFNALGVVVKRWLSVDEMNAYLVPSWPNRFDMLVAYYADTNYELIGSIGSPDEMYESASDIMTKKRQRWVYTHNQRKLTDRGAAVQLFKYAYRDYHCPLNLPYKSYTEFFQAFGFDPTLISPETWQDIAVDAFNKATNYESNTAVSQSEIQRAMVRLMTKLSSYTVHFAARMSSDSYEITDPITPILDDSLLSGAGTLIIDELHTGVQSVKSKSSMRAAKPLDVLPRITKASIPQRMKFLMNILPGIQVRIEQSVTVHVESPTIGVTSVVEETGEGSLKTRIRTRAMPGFTTDNLK